MSITAERKQEVIKEHARGKDDTGSPEVQVAILTEPHQQPDRAFQDPREGQPFAPRPADDGQQAPLAARLSARKDDAALHRSDREARPSQITFESGPVAGRFAYRAVPQFGGAFMGHESAPNRCRPASLHIAAPAGIRPRGAEGKQMFNTKTVEIEWGGKTLKLETGRVARQADGAVLATLGETVVLCAVTAAKSVKPGQDFFPLTVHYQEKFSAAGRIPGGFFKRERGATEKETLTSRLIDRPIRPLFPEGFYNEVLVIAQVLSYDGENEPDILAMIAASAALTLSGVPFMGPIGARPRRLSTTANISSTRPRTQIAEGELDLVVAGTRNAVMMVESEAKELSEEVMLGAVMFAHRECKKVIEAIIKLAEKAAKEPWELATSRRQGRGQGQAQGPDRQGHRRRLQADRQVGALGRAQRRPRQGQGSVRRRRPAGADGRVQAGQEPRGRHRPRRDPQGRPPHRRPRHQDRPPDRGDRRLPAAHPRLGAVHPRRDPGDRAPPRSAPRKRSR